MIIKKIQHTNGSYSYITGDVFMVKNKENPKDVRVVKEIQADSIEEAIKQDNLTS